MWKRVYDQSLVCANCSNCPVVDVDDEKGLVRIWDPADSGKGTFTMTTEEYKMFLANVPRP